MTICPECNREIDHLEHMTSGTNTSDFTVDDGGYTHYDDDLYDDDGSMSDYECPSCGAILAHTEEDAIEILREPKENFPIQK